MGKKSRKILDVSMAILMIVVMSYQATGNLFHEAAGAWGMILVSFHGGMHIRIPGKKKPLYMIVGTLPAAFGIWAFFALDMPNRLILRDTGMYWRYSGFLLFLANAVMMAFFAGVTAIMADWLKKRNRTGK